MLKVKRIQELICRFKGTRRRVGEGIARQRDQVREETEWLGKGACTSEVA